MRGKDEREEQAEERAGDRDDDLVERGNRRELGAIGLGFALDDVHRRELRQRDEAAEGSEPNEYWTPLIVFFQSGFPNQTPNFSMTSPRQRAARKWPSSWTTMRRLKRTTTSRRMKMMRRACRNIGR